MTESATRESSGIFATIPDAVAAIARGEIVVVVDDEDRENEGDLIMAAEHATPEAITFFVRHPVARYVSGFNNFRRALIQEVTKWPNLAEVNGFRFFRTPDELATSLFSDDERIRSAAEYAMANLAFLRNPLVNNLQSIEVVDKYASTIRFVGLFEHFDASIDGMRRAFGLPPELRVTDSERKGHRAPDTLPKTLSAEGREALLEWYRDDLVIYEHCRTIHEQHMNGLGS